jgi:predicted Zn-dependent protease
VVHHRQAGRLDLEALGALLEHAFIRGTQALVLFGRQLVELAADLVHAVDVAHAGYRYPAPGQSDQFVGITHVSLQTARR